MIKTNSEVCRPHNETCLRVVADAIGTDNPDVTALVAELIRDQNDCELHQFTGAKLREAARTSLMFARGAQAAGTLGPYCDVAGLVLPAELPEPADAQVIQFGDRRKEG